MLRGFRLISAVFLGVFALATLTPTPACADEEDRLYDFTDAYYKANGVNPAKISGRRQADKVRAVTDTPNFRFQRNVRVLSTSPAYNHSGDIEFFAVMGGGGTDLFTNDAAGRRARKIADASIEYVFPQTGTNPVGLGASRQSVILDMRNGYFSNNPLGLWLHVWVNWTDEAFDTPWGLAALAELAEENGLALDGTPIIRTIGEIEDLREMGLVTLDTRPGTDPLRYAICPVIKDPTDGGIAPDQFLNYPKLPNGDPLEPQFLRNFLSLQKTGEWDN